MAKDILSGVQYKTLKSFLRDAEKRVQKTIDHTIESEYIHATVEIDGAIASLEAARREIQQGIANYGKPPTTSDNGNKS